MINNDVTARYPELHDVPVSGDVILGGELVVIDPATGLFDFELTMERFSTTRPERIAAACQRLPVSFVVFDILHYNGKDLRSLPLMHRKEILNGVLEDSAHISKTMVVDGAGKALFDVIKQRGMEGVVAKKKDSLYASRRSREWLKVINYSYATVFLIGYKKKEFGRK